jgi:replicative DNA helicase
MSDKTELYILKGLITFDDYLSRFVDKIDHRFFSEKPMGMVFKATQLYFLKYSKKPTLEMLCDVMIPQMCDSYKKPEYISHCVELLQTVSLIKFEKEDYFDWLSEITKDYIQTKRIELALIDCVDLMDKGRKQEAIKKIIDASHVSFDETLGTDYFNDIKDRMDRLKSPDIILKTGLYSLDESVGGGFRNKTLNIFGAATNVGKTLILGHITKSYVESGLNGLYISLEINEDMLSSRIDANISDTALDDINLNPERLMMNILERKKLAEEEGKPFGQLIIKEYPPATINANQILSLVRELEVKRNGFKPKFIALDYIGLMIPNGKGFSDNTYGKLKTVAEELRAVAVKLNIPIFSAVQVNRGGYADAEIGLEKTSDSLGIPMTADVMIMVSRTKEMEELNQVWFNIAKSRFSKNGTGFTVGVDYPHMRLYDVNAGNNNTSTVRKAPSQLKENTNKTKEPHVGGSDSDDLTDSL